MNKKLTILIVALECVFAVFLVSIFGPMIDSLHSKVVVRDIYFVDSNGVRMEDNSSLVVDLDQSRSFHYDFEILPDDATDKRVEIIHNRTNGEIEIEKDSDGLGFTVIFLSKNVSSVRITVRAKDSSQKQATITLVKKLGDVDLGDDF